MGADRHERARQAGVKAGRKRRYNGPPKDEAWGWLSREMISSKAFRALSGNAYKVIFRLAEEHMAHGGTENGKLLVTHKQFADYGIRLASVADAIREAEYFGFIVVDRGIAFKGGHEPNLYRLTWLGDLEDAPPTNQWKAIGEQHVEIWAQRKRTVSLKRKKLKQLRVDRIGVVVPLKA